MLFLLTIGPTLPGTTPCLVQSSNPPNTERVKKSTAIIKKTDDIGKAPSCRPKSCETTNSAVAVNANAKLRVAGLIKSLRTDVHSNLNCILQCIHEAAIASEPRLRYKCRQLPLLSICPDPFWFIFILQRTPFIKFCPIY